MMLINEEAVCLLSAGDSARLLSPRCVQQQEIT